MTKKALFAADTAADFQKKPSLLAGGGVALATALLLFLMGFFAPVGLSAQGCQTNDPANFNFTLVPGGCAVDFAATYAGPGTVTHTWQFYEQPTATGPFSTSNLANPLHTFDAVSQIRLVVHTITITQNGQVTTHTCSRLVDYACDGCSLSSRRFTYAVNGCTVTFTALNTNEPATWTFGDGNTATGTVVTHNYGGNGDFTVILTQNNFTCSKRIRTFCAAMGCCNADFTGSVTRECATLCLNLDAACEMDGQHTWIVSGSPCLTVASLNSSPNQPCIQLTNINTKNTTSVTVTHVLTCPNGTSQTLTKTIPIPTNVGEAVFIGIRRPQPTNLSDFACVIPGLKYPISTAAVDALPLYVSGIVQVNKGTTSSAFSFLGADVRMDPGMTGFDVLGKRRLSMGMSKSGMATTMRGVPDCNCLWRGNRVLSKGRLTTGTAFSQQTGDAIIEDAVFGIRAQPGSVLEIQGTSFRRNFVGIRATEGNFSLLQFRGNEFDGQGPLKEICTLNNLIKDIRVPGGGLDPGETFPTLGGPFTPYQTGKGLAGMYLRRLSSFNLLPLSVESQNIFQNICYGIMAYDCNVDIASNCRFLNLSGGGAYGLRRTGGIFSVDGALNGPNTFRFVGNGQDALPAAFENCVLGIYARSEQGAAPTNINISNTRMEGVRNGVFMDALYLSGAFRGNATNGNFLGIHHNRINASMTAFNHNSVYSNAGITFGDYNPTVSNIEIYNNNVRVSYFTTGDFESVSGGTFGIVGWGLWPGSDPGPNIIELDIHDNRVEVTDMAQAGIGLELHPNGVIRNQRGGNAAAGNGIFMNGTEMWAGITTIEGNRNLIACNEITTTVPPTFLSLLQSRFQTNTDYFRNTMTGPGVGAQFREMCDNARFQCNEMNNNTVGLSYVENAVTGPQGTAAVTFENRWVGNFTTGAEFIGFDPTPSQYFTRNTNNETPLSLSAPPNWFFTSNPTATVGCILENCPAPPGMVPPVIVTRLDEQVAADSLNYGTLSHAAEQEWQHRYLLYRKLIDYPQLTQGNALVQGFAAAPGDNIPALWQAELASRSALVPSAVVQSAMTPHQQGTQAAQTQLHLIDSLLAITEDSAQFVALIQQRDVQDSILNVLALAGETLATQFTALRDAAIPGILNQLVAISPANVCEANLRRAHEIYLLTAAVGVLPDSIELADLRSIGEQCRPVGGPGVAIAQGLYQSFTGEALIENCDSTANRSGAQTSVQGALMEVYPNPNHGGFVVQLPDTYAEKDALLRITNAFGTEVQSLRTAGRTALEVNLVSQPSGVYFVVLRDGADTSTRPVLIQR